jgi:hypothetical protein
MSPDNLATRIESIQQLRLQAARLIALLDLILYGSNYDSQRALRQLPNQVRVVMFRCTRLLAALGGSDRP